MRYGEGPSREIFRTHGEFNTTSGPLEGSIAWAGLGSCRFASRMPHVESSCRERLEGLVGGVGVNPGS